LQLDIENCNRDVKDINGIFAVFIGEITERLNYRPYQYRIQKNLMPFGFIK
jgi:hypothetical protein